MDAYLHIGVGKTGTSTIQKFLFSNNKALKKQGFCFPTSVLRGRSGRQIKLGAYGLMDDLFTDPRKILRVPPAKVASFRKEVEAELDAEMKGLPKRIRTVIFSDEGMCSFKETEEVQRMYDLLKPYFSSIKVIVYMRRQDQHSVSQHSQHLKAGRSGRKILRETPYYDYDALLDLWAGVFGEENVIPRIFERERFPEGDVVHDFLQVCGVDYTKDFKSPGKLNESLSPEAEVFLMYMNRSLKKFVDGELNVGRNRLVRHLLDAYSGKGLRPARKAAERFYDEYAESNERVRKRWFPEQKTLFDMDFSSYPETGHDRSMDTDALMEVAATVIERLSVDYVEVKTENNRLLAKLVESGVMSLEESGLLPDQYERLREDEDA